MLIRQRCLLIILLLISVCSSYSYDKLEEFKYNQNILLTGIVSGIPKLQDDQYEFIFHSYKYGDILLKADKSYHHYLIPANKLELEAKIYKPHEYDNLAAFNYAEYLEHNDIIALGKVIDNSAIAYKGTASLYLPQRIRYYLYNHLQRQLSNFKQKDFAIALLIGDKNFDQSQQNLLISSGTSHLMVISGLHVGLLAFIAFIVFRGLWSLSPRLCRNLPAQYIGVIASVIIAFIYSLLAGFSLPTQRALIMLLVVAMLWLFGKRISIVKSLLVAFVIILLIDFESIYSISLWLSFSAVILLVIISIVLQQYKSKLTKILLAQTYLAIFLVPISVYYFGGFSVVSILANIVAIPLVSFVIVPLLLLCLLLSFIGINLWLLPMMFLKLLVAYLSFLTNYAGFISYWSYFSFFSLVIIILGIILVIFPFSKPLRILGLAMCLVFFQSSQNSAEKYQRFQIDIFDTQNQMVLVQDQGKNLLYTAAKNLANEYLLANVLESYLRFAGIKQIDYLIIVDGNKNLNLKLIRQITSIKTVITNISTNEDVQKCSYANNFKLNSHTSVKLLSNAQSCFTSLNYQGKEFLLADNSNQKAQQQLYTLYNRVIQPQIIITPAIIDSKFLNQDVDYLVYISDKPLKGQNSKNTKLKIFDTYANGLITIKINNHHSITISSQLKQY
ncbi:ComEC/Rec2 family competence protein [Francisella tularensis]|uniref:ComEC/Rec2 family competence protein n=1 Tax=Francisella tularensis TaxID=263 RepID=UPI0008F536F5|nr:ComEC/Rec2 family competence protein [Francisella tularensis]APA82177.1 DNA internalization-related competence protein ComEC/Rec2 [Francisella tularensis subsp. novicida PA10-7858]